MKIPLLSNATSQPGSRARQLIVCALLVVSVPVTQADTTLLEEFSSTSIIPIPDGDPSGVVKSINTNDSSIGTLGKVTVDLDISSTWNGDIYSHLSHTDLAHPVQPVVVLVNRIGRTAALDSGSDTGGLNITLDDSGVANIHGATGTTGNPIAGIFQPDRRLGSPGFDVIDTTPLGPNLASFNVTTATGTWNILTADVAGGELATWNSAKLNLTGILSGNNFAKNGTHTTTIIGTSDYAGSTTVNAGSLIASATGSLGTTSNIQINGGSLLLSGAALNKVSDTAPIILAGGNFNVSGQTETMGALSLSGVNSVIDMGGASVISFASAGSSSWTGNLSVWNWNGNLAGGGTDQFRFLSNANNSNVNLSNVSFYSNAGTTFIANGAFVSGGTELVPVPEANHAAAIASLCLLIFRREFRRTRSSGMLGC